MTFEERIVKIPALELDRLRGLTLSDSEYGGRLVPKRVGGVCVLECETHLIQGTGVKKVTGDDAKNYSGGASSSVKLLSTPFTHREIINSVELCTRPGDHANIFWHSHPVSVCTISPPSLGDFAAHAVLGNLRNWDQQRQINTSIIVAFEGIYEYGITEERFKDFVAITNTLMEGRPWGRRDLPEYVAKHLRSMVFDELRDGYHAFFEATHEMEDSPAFDKKGAPMFRNKRWSCADHVQCGVEGLDFPYKHSLDDPEFIRDLSHFQTVNPYANTLNRHGFYYRFIPYMGQVGLPVKVNRK